MTGNIERILDALNRAGVRYLVVGGVAVVLHGYLRTTADLDLIVHLERSNTLRALRALAGIGYRPRPPVEMEAFANAETRSEWIRDKNLKVFSLYNTAIPALEIDIFVEEPFDFNAAYDRSLRVRLETADATVIGMDDLIALKRLTGRPRDLEDIQALTALKERPPKGGE